MFGLLICGEGKLNEYGVMLYFKVQTNVLFYLGFCKIAGQNCCLNSSRVDNFLEYEPHPSSVKNLRHLFQSMLHTFF